MGSEPLSLLAGVRFRAQAVPLVLLDRADEAVQAQLACVPMVDEEAAGLAAIAHAGRRAELADRRRALRLFASLHLTCLPQDVPLTHGLAGEPLLAGGPFVSLSSRGRFIALSCLPQPHGVDIEAFSLDAPVAALHPEEAALCRTASPQMIAALWAAKEAHWKAHRLPLSRDPATFCVRIRADGTFSVDDPLSGHSHGAVRMFQEQNLVLALALSDKAG